MFNLLGMTRPIYKSYIPPRPILLMPTLEHPHIHVKILIYILLNVNSFKEKIVWKRKKKKSNLTWMQPLKIHFWLWLFWLGGCSATSCHQGTPLELDWATKSSSPAVCKMPLYQTSTFMILLLCIALQRSIKLKPTDSLCSAPSLDVSQRQNLHLTVSNWHQLQDGVKQREKKSHT